MPLAALTPPNNRLSGAGLPWPLHEACAAWPAMSPADLRALADDIAIHGLHDPITLTPIIFYSTGAIAPWLASWLASSLAL